jgi:hypothetical protein
MRYVIVYGTPDEVTDAVRLRLADGWELYGPASCTATGEYQFMRVIQPMIKKKDKPCDASTAQPNSL